VIYGFESLNHLPNKDGSSLNYRVDYHADPGCWCG
jgi:hypothetical protein